jgi:hypothetical protein
MSSLIIPMCIALMVGFAILSVWALLSLRRQTLPAAYYLAMNGLHVLLIATLTLGVLNNGGPTGLTKFLEYMLVFVGGGVIYTRGLIPPDGFMWKILNDAPKVPQGMLTGNGWNAAAVLASCSLRSVASKTSRLGQSGLNHSRLGSMIDPSDSAGRSA